MWITHVDCQTIPFVNYLNYKLTFTVYKITRNVGHIAAIALLFNIRMIDQITVIFFSLPRLIHGNIGEDC
jgi:hypothetical protein